MAARKQADSDPLPYVQVDRSAKPRAALLAGSLGVTPQHALGSLVEWWDLNGDPRECERLQGFPDDWTAIEGAKDTPRYAALGNSMAVPVMRWIGRRIELVDSIFQEDL